MKRSRFLMILVVFVITLVLQTIPTQAYPVTGWSRIYEGIQYATGYTTSPRLMRAFALRINLRNPDVGLYASHDNGGSPYETMLQTTPDLLYEHGLKAAVNATFFNANLSPNTDLYGLEVCNGTVVSPPDAAAPFNNHLSFTIDKIPTLTTGNTVPAGSYTASAGAEIILVNGVTSSGNTDVQPRTFAGISQDNKFLILVCVDGRQSGWSLGCNHPEAAQWLRDFGGWNGFLFDGGGSTTMDRADVGVVNRPCYGYPRAVGASIGAYSALGNSTVGPTACSVGGGRYDVATRGHQNHIYIKTYLANTGWSDPVDIGGNTTDTPGIVARDANNMTVMWRGSDNALYYKNWTTGTWGSEVRLQTVMWSGPGVCKRDANHMSVFFRGQDNTIWYKNYDNGVWGADQNLQGSITYDMPAPVSRDANHMDVFFRGQDNGLWCRSWANGVWGADQYIGCTDLSSAPTACSHSATTMDVFFRGGDRQEWYRSWNSSTGWASPGCLGGGLVTQPAAVASPDGTIMVTYHRYADDCMYQKHWESSTNQWDVNWTNIGLYF